MCDLRLNISKFACVIEAVKFFYAGMNCRLKVKWENESINDQVFISLDELKVLVNLMKNLDMF